MHTVMDVARGIGVSRQVEARELAMGNAVRLANRERRLRARLTRLQGRRARSTGGS